MVPGLDTAAVLGDDAPHDREPQPAAATLRRVIGHEQLLAVGGRNARPVVRDEDPGHAVHGIELRLDNDQRRIAAWPRLGAAPSERFDRIVDEVDDDAANLLDVDAYGRERC